MSLDPNIDEYLRKRRQASVVPKVAYCTERVALKVVSQALGVQAALSINRRTSTRSARLWTVSLDPNLDENLRKRRQASAVPKVAYCTERVDSVLCCLLSAEETLCSRVHEREM
jgi:hypothetical protein